MNGRAEPDAGPARVSPRSSGPWGSRLRIDLLVLAAGIALSTLLGLYVVDQAESGARLRFDNDAVDASEAVSTRIRNYTDALAGLRGLFAASSEVSRAEFNAYVNTLNVASNYPGIQSLTYIRRVPHAHKAAFEQSVRNDRSLDAAGYPQFAIRPPGERDDYFVIDYVEPMAGNEAAFGFDHGHEAVRRAQIDRAMESGEATASARVKLVQPHLTGAGFSMRLAVYARGAPLNTPEQRRQATIGLVGAAFSADNLLQGVVGRTISNRVQLKIYDTGQSDALPVTARSAERLMFDSTTTFASGAEPASWIARLVSGETTHFERTISITVGARKWDLYFSAPRDLTSAEYLQWPLLTFCAGMAISLLLFSLVRSLDASRRRAHALAGEMTRDLRATEAETRKLSLVASRTHNAVVITDAQKSIEWVNDGFTRITGYTLDEVRGRVPGHFLQGPDTDPATVSRLRASLARNEGCRVEILNYGKTGRRYWLDVEIQPIYAENGELSNFIAIETEITERKRIEHAIRDQAEQIRLITDNVPVAIAYYDARRVCRFANRGYAEIFGFTVAEMIGKPLDGIVKAVNHAEVNAHVDAVMQGRPEHYLHRMELPDMRVAHMDVTLVPHLDDSAAVAGFYVMRVDVTERQIAEADLRATRERLDLALDGSELALWDWEITSGRVYTSERWSEMLGGAKVSGVTEFRELEMLVHPDDRARVGQRISAVLQGKTAIYYAEHRVRTLNGVGSSRVDLQACKLEYSIVSPK